jgi:hypothetical protein
MSDASDDTAPRRRSPRVPYVIIGLMLLMPVLYVASTGPVRWLVERNWISEPTGEYLQYVYLPIMIACEAFPFVEELLGAYTSLWVP